jgi:flagellar biosynthesis/type III secretory pathway protein FliH
LPHEEGRPTQAAPQNNSIPIVVDATADAGPAASRLREALADPDHLFTRDQVAWLMGLAQRWAQEHALDVLRDSVQAAYEEGHERGHADGFEAGRHDAIFCDVQALIQRAYLPEATRRRHLAVAA